jgi:hypothetical protein
MNEPKKPTTLAETAETDRNAILQRRAAMIAATVASLGIACAATPQLQSSSPAEATSAPPAHETAPVPASAFASEDASVVGAPTQTDPSLDASARPRACLRIVPPGSPKPCLQVLIVDEEHKRSR